jgi:hypothetical protein
MGFHRRSKKSIKMFGGDRHSSFIIHNSLCLALDRLTARQGSKLENFIAHHDVLKIVNELTSCTRI